MKARSGGVGSQGSPAARLFLALALLGTALQCVSLVRRVQQRQTDHLRPATDTSSSTAFSPPGKPADLYWDPTDTTPYKCGAAKLPAATLLHELTHAWENYNGLDNGELAAVRAENWLIWRLGGVQRTHYQVGDDPSNDCQTLPADQVIWPQAASASSQ